jgi:hypothetical protein
MKSIKLSVLIAVNLKNLKKIKVKDQVIIVLV